MHLVTGQKLFVLRRTTADGKARRTSTGSSTACSVFPIPKAPEHIDQPGDRKILFLEPTWCLEETEKPGESSLLLQQEQHILFVNFNIKYTIFEGHSVLLLSSCIL